MNRKGVIGDYHIWWNESTNDWNIRWEGNFIPYDFETGDELMTGPGRNDWSEVPEDYEDDCNEWFASLMDKFTIPTELKGGDFWCYVCYESEDKVEARLEGEDSNGDEFCYYIT